MGKTATITESKFFDPLCASKVQLLSLLQRCAYELAKIAAKQGHFKKAYDLNERAYKCISSGKPTHTSVMATQYRQGYVCMQTEDCKNEEDRNFDEALRHLRDALTICQLHEVRRGNKGESARVKWRTSQILVKQGLESEARTFRESAQKTKKELRDTGLYPDPAGEEESWDCFLGLLYR
jgi:tetratricopeptide (TPR) repeat protein